MKAYIDEIGEIAAEIRKYDVPISVLERMELAIQIQRNKIIDTGFDDIRKILEKELSEIDKSCARE